MIGSVETEPSWRFRLSFAFLIFAAMYSYLLMISNFSVLADGDSYWHIATGRWIIENNSVPRTDIFSHTFLNELWLAKEWLSQIILYYAYQIGGWQGLNSFTLMLVALTIAIISVICLSHLRFSLAIGLTFILAVFGSIHYLARPHMISYPIMLLWTMGVVFAADRKQAPSFWLLPLMTIWANLHGGFTLGLAIAGLMSLETIMSKPRAELVQHLIRHGLFLGLAAIAAIITPFGLQSILITPKIMGLGEVLDHIGEWKTPNFHVYEYHLIVLMTLLGFAFYGGLRLKLMRVVAVVLLTYLMFKHLRAMAVFGFLVPILMMHPVAEQFKKISSRHQYSSDEDDPVLDFFEKHIRKMPYVAGLILAMGIGQAATDLEYGKVSGKTKPVEEVTFAKSHGLTGKVFNDYDFGGYLIFQDIPTYIDGRAELYGRDFFVEYYDATWNRGGGDILGLLEKHDITWTLLRPQAGSVAILDQSENWRCVHLGPVAMIHVRVDDQKAAEILKAAGDAPCKTANKEKLETAD